MAVVVVNSIFAASSLVSDYNESEIFIIDTNKLDTSNDLANYIKTQIELNETIINIDLAEFSDEEVDLELTHAEVKLPLVVDAVVELYWGDDNV